MDVAAMKHMASNFSKLDKFEGLDFRRWQKKMHFLLSSMSVVYVLTTPIPEDEGDNPTVEQILVSYNVYRYSLEAKYMAEDALSKKFLEELTLVELGSHLCIEDSIRVQDNDKPKSNNVAGPSVVNMIEHNNSFRYNDNKGLLKGVNVGNMANGSCTKGLVDGSSNSLKGQNMINKSLQVYYVTYVSEAYFVQDGDGCLVGWTKEESVHVCVKIDDDLRAVVRLSDPKLKTLGERGIECIFVGYATHSKAFRFFVIEPNESVATNSIIGSRDAIFNENRFSSVPRPSQRSLVNGIEDISASVVLEKVTEEVVQQPEPELRKSKRHRSLKDFGPEKEIRRIVDL
ncbi:hypothetical protein Tco_1523157 [Tanacetum coccineum]